MCQNNASKRFSKCWLQVEIITVKYFLKALDLQMHTPELHPSQRKQTGELKFPRYGKFNVAFEQNGKMNMELSHFL
jgi:hypothetical protein